jgi:hypothetical protein
MMLIRRRSLGARRYSELRTIRFSIADQLADLERARELGAEQSVIDRIEANLEWLKQSLERMKRT